MSYCGGLQYYCKLGATSQAMHICYFKNQQGKHPVYKTVRKKILKISLAPTDFKREELIRMWNPSSSFLLFLFFFPPRREPNVSCFV
uniref:Uncharacterized protein n=1 Tax=Zosterops lateralis melanops TaxID=1220523 RepID=A0A8D2Q362_ZOSLA